MGARRALKARWALTAILIFIAGSACGSNGDSQDLGAFADRYRDITAQYRADTEAIQQQVGSSAQAEGLAAAVDLYKQLLEVTEDIHHSFEALDPPGDFQEPIETMTESLDQQVAVLSELVEGAEEQNLGATTSAANELAELQQQWNEARLEIESLLEECGEECE